MNTLEVFLHRMMRFELTHQDILEWLLLEPNFRKKLLDIDINNTEIIHEPERGLFDIGIKSNGKYIALIELKMWSNLDTPQLTRQVDFLNTLPNVKGFWILLGSADMLYLKNDYHDFLQSSAVNIAKENHQNNDFKATKIGYERLIDALGSIQSNDTHKQELAENYRKALRALMNATFEDYKTSSGFHLNRTYSRFYQVQLFCPKLNTQIRPISNRGETKAILIDNGLWLDVYYKGYRFDFYQELHAFNEHHIEHHIRAHNDNSKVPLHIRAEFRNVFNEMIQNSELHQEDWKYGGHNRIWLILARKTITLNTEKEFKNTAKRMKKVHNILHIFKEKITQLV